MRRQLAALLLSCSLAGCTHGQSGAVSPTYGGDGGNAAVLGQAGAAPSSPKLLAGRWRPGGNFTVLSPAQPDNVPPGKVHVTEVFWYGCPHCYAFDPYLNKWLASKPEYVQFRRVPVMWGDIHRAHARLFYTLQVLGKLDELHGKVFDAIHGGEPLYIAGNPDATFAAQLSFAQANGISAAAFTSAYHSATVENDLSQAAGLDERYKVDSVPTMVVDGKYESDPGLAGSEENLLALVNDLIAEERH